MPWASSRFSMKLRPLRNSLRASSRSRTTANHMFHPRESSRLKKNIKARAMGSSRTMSPLKADIAFASLRFTILLRLLRSFWRNSARSTAISSHAPKPRDRPRLSMCPRLLRIDSRFAFSSSIIDCQERKPFDSPRFIMWKKPLLMTVEPCKERVQLSKPSASLRFTIRLSPLRSLRRNAARSSSISTQAPQPRDRPRWRRCPRLLRIDSRFALSTSHVSYHATQPRESSRLRK